MRLLHTADWHLGRSFHGASMEGAQAAALDHLVEVAREARPDAVLVAGDVFDRAYPPLAAVELYDDVIARLADVGIPVVVTSGNHDSAVRLGMYGRVAAAAGIHVVTRTEQIGTPVELERDGARALIYPVPYLDPPLQAGRMDAEATHAGVLGAAMARIRADRTHRGGSAATIVVAHGTVAGGARVSEDPARRVERPIDVGGVEAVEPSVLRGIDYVALGHLHRPQGIGPHIRYSGALMPFGFDEAGEEKSLVLVQVEPGAAPRHELVAVPQERAAARLQGTLEELLTSAEHAWAETAWVEATLTDRLQPRLAMERLRQRFPHALALRHRPPVAMGDGSAAASYATRVRGRQPLDVAARFLAEVRPGAPADEDELALLREALIAGRPELETAGA